jgi:hypothetical protein
VEKEGISLGQAEIISKYPSGKAFEISTVEYGIMTVPVSALHDDSEVYAVEHKGKLVVKSWFASKKGLL